MAMPKGHREAGLRHALDIQRRYPQDQWLKLGSEIEDKAERKYAVEYLSNMLLRISNAKKAAA